MKLNSKDLAAIAQLKQNRNQGYEAIIKLLKSTRQSDLESLAHQQDINDIRVTQGSVQLCDTLLSTLEDPELQIN